MEVFIDETGYNFHCHRRRGRSLIGTPAVQTVVTQKGINLSLIAAMTSDGVIHKNMKRGSITKDDFQTFLIELSTLLGEETKATFIFDNCRCHFAVESYYEAHSIERIPPYSPFLNAIEELFSSLKRNIRIKLSTSLEHVASLKGTEREKWLIDEVCGELESISPEKCNQWVKHRKAFYPNCILMNNIK